MKIDFNVLLSLKKTVCHFMCVVGGGGQKTIGKLAQERG